MNKGRLQRWPKRTFKERFEEKIYYGLDGCWYWTACVNEHGYGEIATANGRKQLANRASYTLYKGEIPAGLFVCHSCDNPLCVNPDHLFLGAHTDNMRDMYKKNRRSHQHLRGINNPRSKLNEQQVMEIKRSTRGRGVAAALSKEYGVSKHVIYGIMNGSQWSHVTSVTIREEAKLLFVKA